MQSKSEQMDVCTCHLVRPSSIIERFSRRRQQHPLRRLFDKLKVKEDAKKSTKSPINLMMLSAEKARSLESLPSTTVDYCIEEWKNVWSSNWETRITRSRIQLLNRHCEDLPCNTVTGKADKILAWDDTRKRPPYADESDYDYDEESIDE